ncbi:CBS domain-containing protein [Haloplanus aerogenes]|uniref:CBS domain protein n=1 Tax=Haloplanus aerogenes TaxID=660522 RepID=A0A3M0DQ90_9EURY|nr:CBS domain-containing protein [Haloplanus aerogenes]AZH24598.1 CBS domain-containing protein [Haloplanus aerogenes]RMB23744.1 CBS domain protein [Haloplanus aerogenes]
MEDVFVGSLMSAPVHSVGGDATLREAGRVLLDHDIGSVVVVDEAGSLRGILTATDFVRVVADGEESASTPVSTVMSHDVVTTTGNEPITVAADLMVESGHYHLPVVDGESVIGVITAADLAAYLSTIRPPHPPWR